MAPESVIQLYDLNMIGRHARIELRLPQLATPGTGVCSAKQFNYICVLIIQLIVLIKRLPFLVLYFRSAFYTTVPFRRIYPHLVLSVYSLLHSEALHFVKRPSASLASRWKKFFSDVLASLCPFPTAVCFSAFCQYVFEGIYIGSSGGVVLDLMMALPFNLSFND